MKMGLTKTRYFLSNKEVKKLMDAFKTDIPEDAIEKYAYDEFDLRHNCSIILGAIGKTYFEIVEMP